jgi:hypothetical protein
MSRHTIADYTFSALQGLKKPITAGPSLVYLIGLVDKANHAISDPVAAKRILSWLYEIEEQTEDAIHLDVRQSQFFSRYFQEGYYPQTPCMVTQAWSPIAALLESGFEPVVLRREHKILAAATGIWEPVSKGGVKEINRCVTADELFWRLLSEVCTRATERHMWVSIIAQPGWHYNAAIGSLPKWSSAEVEKADRIIWQRTPEG